MAQFPEILPEEVLAKMHATPKADVPVADVHDLPSYDGFILGFPTRCITWVAACLGGMTSVVPEVSAVRRRTRMK
jgi:hypothetical protein